MEINPDRKTEPGNRKPKYLHRSSWPHHLLLPSLSGSNMSSTVPEHTDCLVIIYWKWSEYYAFHEANINEAESTNSLPPIFLIVSIPETYPASSNPTPLSHPVLITTQDCAPSEAFCSSFLLFSFFHTFLVERASTFPRKPVAPFLSSPSQGTRHSRLWINPGGPPLEDRRHFHNHSHKTSKLMTHTFTSVHHSFFILLWVLVLSSGWA